MKKLLVAALAAGFALSFAGQAYAAPKHKHRTKSHQTVVCNKLGCGFAFFGAIERDAHTVYRRARRVVERAGKDLYRVVGTRPAACAKFGRYWCGCGTARKLGVEHVPGNKALARNYPRLFKSVRGPCVGCAAWRPGHVKAIIGGGPGAWEVYDPNAGPRDNRGVRKAVEYTTASFRGYRFVDTSQPLHRVAMQ